MWTTLTITLLSKQERRIDLSTTSKNEKKKTRISSQWTFRPIWYTERKTENFTLDNNQKT